MRKFVENAQAVAQLVVMMKYTALQRLGGMIDSAEATGK